MAKDGHCGITGSGENCIQHVNFLAAERSQYVIDDITPASRTPDTDAQTGKLTAAQGIHN